MTKTSFEASFERGPVAATRRAMTNVEAPSAEALDPTIGKPLGVSQRDNNLSLYAGDPLKIQFVVARRSPQSSQIDDLLCVPIGCFSWPFGHEMAPHLFPYSSHSMQIFRGGNADFGSRCRF